MNAGVARMATTSASDAELVGAVRAGDEAAFEELFRRYRPRVHAFVHRRVRDQGRAEELTQEAFLSALRRLRETESEVAFRPWIYEIARNSTIDHFRRSSRADEVSVESVDELGAGDHLRLVSDRGPEPELESKQRLEALQGAFGELSAKHERILVMRELEGLSYREIGERMELTRPGVESTLFRARRRLQTEFAELETGRRCLAVRAAMGRLAEEADRRGDRGRVARHARRCPACGAIARRLGLVSGRPSPAARVAALLPLPAFLARRFDSDEVSTALGGKAAAAAAVVVLAGGGPGLTTGTHGDAAPPSAAPQHARPAPSGRQAGQTARRVGHRLSRPPAPAEAEGRASRLFVPPARPRAAHEIPPAPAVEQPARPRTALDTAPTADPLPQSSPAPDAVAEAPRPLLRQGSPTVPTAVPTPQPVDGPAPAPPAPSAPATR